MSLCAEKAGLVVDRATRDIARIADRDIPVYARGVSCRGPYKDGPDAINVEMTIGGMVVRPGDIVVDDRDGRRHPRRKMESLRRRRAGGALRQPSAAQSRSAGSRRRSCQFTNR